VPFEPTKFGPPESPKQVPPVLALFESSNEKSPTMPPLIWIRRGVASNASCCYVPEGRRSGPPEPIADRRERESRGRACLERVELIRRRKHAIGRTGGDGELK
jgi:hypothetical protein